MAIADDRDGYPSDLAERFQVRMPTGLRHRIKAAADANNRSMNAEIVSTLEEKYPEQDSILNNLSALHAMLDEIKGDPNHPRWVDFAKISDETLHLIRKETAAMRVKAKE